MNSVDYEQFKSDLCASELPWNTPRHLEDLVNTYKYDAFSTPGQTRFSLFEISSTQDSCNLVHR